MNELGASDLEFFKETLKTLLLDGDNETSSDMLAICDELIAGYYEKDKQ